MDELFRVALPLLVLTGVVMLFTTMIRDDLRRRRIRRTQRVRYLEGVGLLLALDAPSLTLFDLNLYRLNRYVAKRAGMMSWRVNA